MRVSVSDMSSQAKLGRAKVYKTPGKSPSSDFDREVFLLSAGPVQALPEFQLGSSTEYFARYGLVAPKGISVFPPTIRTPGDCNVT